jgi:hypothetical protein
MSLCFYADQAAMIFTMRLVSMKVDGGDALLASPMGVGL